MREPDRDGTCADDDVSTNDRLPHDDDRAPALSSAGFGQPPGRADSTAVGADLHYRKPRSTCGTSRGHDVCFQTNSAQETQKFRPRGAAKRRLQRRQDTRIPATSARNKETAAGCVRESTDGQDDAEARPTACGWTRCRSTNRPHWLMPKLRHRGGRTALR